MGIYLNAKDRAYIDGIKQNGRKRPAHRHKPSARAKLSVVAKERWAAVKAVGPVTRGFKLK